MNALPECTMLVNASHPLPLEWKPDALVDLWEAQPRHYHLYPRPMMLSACAAEAANELFAFAEEQGFDDFIVLSAYRDSVYQAAQGIAPPLHDLALTLPMRPR